MASRKEDRYLILPTRFVDRILDYSYDETSGKWIGSVHYAISPPLLSHPHIAFLGEIKKIKWLEILYPGGKRQHVKIQGIEKLDAFGSGKERKSTKWVIIPKNESIGEKKNDSN